MPTSIKKEKILTKKEEEIAYKILGNWLKLQFTILGANGVVFFILGYFDLLEKGFVFFGLFYIFMFFNVRRILHTYLNKQDQKVLDKLSGLL